MKTYSMDLRERVVWACDEGIGTRKEIAQRFGVSTAWIRRLLQRRRQTGSIGPEPHGGGMPARFAGKRLDRLKHLVEVDPDATLEELRDLSGEDCSLMAVFRALAKLGCRRKKRPSTRLNKTAPT
jgi:transposase